MSRDYDRCPEIAPEAYGAERMACILKTGHIGHHRLADGGRWIPSDLAPCCGEITQGSGSFGNILVCILNPGHWNEHSTRDGHSWERVR